MRLKDCSVMAVVAVFIASFSTTRAIDLVAPAGLNPGDSFRFLFVTSGTRDATSTSIDTYNTFVSNAAAGYTFNGQSITWKAIATTSTVNARENVGGFNTTVPVYLTTGTILADDMTTTGQGLWSGTLKAAPDKGIDGATVSGSSVWTGSNTDGTRLVGSYFGDSYVGYGDRTIATDWIFIDSAAPSADTYALYGLSSALTVPVPEPSTYAMDAIATGVMAAVARRRRA